jgi:hypothetical protein
MCLLKGHRVCVNVRLKSGFLTLHCIGVGYPETDQAEKARLASLAWHILQRLSYGSDLLTLPGIGFFVL